jgi:hypothetical protein
MVLDEIENQSYKKYGLINFRKFLLHLPKFPTDQFSMLEDREVLGTGHYCIPKMVCDILKLFKRYLLIVWC